MNEWDGSELCLREAVQNIPLVKAALDHLARAGNDVRAQNTQVLLQGGSHSQARGISTPMK